MIEILRIQGVNLYSFVSKPRLLQEKGYTYHTGLESRFILPLQKFAPVNIREEMVCLDFCGSICAETTLRVAVKKTGQEIASCGGYDIVAWEC